MISEDEARKLAQRYADQAPREHVMEYAKIPADIRAAYEACRGEPGGDPISTGVATAIRADQGGYWMLAVAGNPIMLTEAAREHVPDAVGAIAPDVLRLRPVRMEEIALFDDPADREILSRKAAARIMGRRSRAVNSPAQQQAARENGKLGGWPKGRPRKEWKE